VYKILAAAVYLSCKARHKPAQVDGGEILPDLSTSRTTTYFVVLKDSSPWKETHSIIQSSANNLRQLREGCNFAASVFQDG
jgi:hypothetical protein